MKYKVPERWEAYEPMGRQIPGTRFICFKVPLKQEIAENAVRKGAEWFSPRTLMDHCLNLGLVVDLTYTDRFYDPKVFTSQGIKYSKVLTQGQVIPKEKVIRQFFKIVNTFLEENKENEKLIGVHCTHGVNRTGYLVCRYMIEHLGIPPDQAIADFNSARGHEQERKEYLVHLRQMKWQQEPVAPDSDKEEEPEGQKISVVVSTPTAEGRRTKRNFDAIRDEDEDEESWPTGPVRKWPRTPHTQRKSYGSYDGPSGSNNSPFSRGSDQRSSDTPKHKVKTSPYGGQRYYDSYYRGRVAPQYDPNFYQQQGSGVGPHRHSPRWQPRNVHWDNNNTHWEGNNTYERPRQYRGPRQYDTPPQRERETLDQSTHYYNRNQENWQRRNPFSPGTSGNVFSPGTPRNRRYQRK